MSTLLRRPVGRVLVAGPSMAPTLRHGDAVLVRPGARIRPGDLVIGRFPAGPDRLVVKRAVRPVDGGWWLEGDNPLVTDDSRRYGPAVVLARVLLRYWPPRRAWPRCRRRGAGPPSGRRRRAPRWRGQAWRRAA